MHFLALILFIQVFHRRYLITLSFSGVQTRNHRLQKCDGRNQLVATTRPITYRRKPLSSTLFERNDANVFISEETVPSNSTVLLPEKTFNLYCRLHCTLTLLQKYFPALLELPSVSTSTVQQWIYDSNITITGPKGEQLAVGVEEVLGVSRALAVVTIAARRAGSLLDLAVTGGRRGASSESKPTLSDQVDCEFFLDPDNIFQVLVLWRTRLPQPSLQSNDKQYTEISGRSVLELSRRTGRVANLQIQKVQINGVTIIESLGSALATIRSTARSSTLFESLSGSTSSTGSSGNALLDGILSGIRDVVDAVEALPSSEADTLDEDSSLYVLPQADWKNISFPLVDKSNKDTLTSPIQIEDYFVFDACDKFPIVGSQSFVEYALIHKSLVNLEKYGLYQLAGKGMHSDSSNESIRLLFSNNVRLVTLSGDKSASDEHMTLLKGVSNVADLYRSLALLRQSSNGDWNIKNTEINWKERSLVVSWESKSPLKVEGSDKFVLEEPVLATSYNHLPLINDGDKEDITKMCSVFFDDTTASPLKIARIENLHLMVGGVAVDSEWANSFIAAALRTGIVGNTPIPDPTISELLRALANRRPTTIKSSTPKKESISAMPPLEDSAAVSFYGILRSLHLDLSRIGNVDIKSASPAGAFLSEDIELRGLLRERLVQGVQGYNRLVSVAILSLRAAIQTGRVRLAAPPRPTVEITAKGSIKVDFLLALWVDAPTFPLTQTPNQALGGFGVPLKIQLVSEYVIDKSGRIREHLILESRLNGVLTPGDVFSRWIKGLASPSEVDVIDGNGVQNAFEQLVGAVSWVKSMQNRKTN